MTSPQAIKQSLKASALKAKDRVGLVAPASRPYKPSEVIRAVTLVAELGFVPVVGPNVLKIKGHSAGTDEQRLSDFNSFLNDDSIAGIFCITGGFGALPLVGRLDYAAMRKRPKVIVGGDENTVILLAAYSQTGLICFHGPNLDEVKTQECFTNLKYAVTNTKPLFSIAGATVRSAWEMTPKYVPYEGIAEGNLVGGNLSSLTSLFGTPFQPSIQDSLLFLTDRDERHDILDRWFTTLYVSGELAKVKAAVIGYFDNCGSKGSYNLLSLEDLFGERLNQLKIPSCFDFPIAGGPDCPTVPIGVMAKFATKKSKLEFLEPALL